MSRKLREPWGTVGPELGASFSQEPLLCKPFSSRFGHFWQFWQFWPFWPFWPFRQFCLLGSGTRARYEVKYLVPVSYKI
jgi:hypothetical protein